MRSVILHRNNTVRGMQHNLFIDSNPEADTRHHVSGLLLTSLQETLVGFRRWYELMNRLN